jgi:hypothetical protein
MLTELKHSIIVYNPGYAGNFLIRLFSLGIEVMPQITVDTLTNLTSNLRTILEGKNKLQKYSTKERLELYSFANVKSNYLNWQKFHRDWTDFGHYDRIKLISGYESYTHIMFAMHVPELELNSSSINAIQDVTYFYVDLDLEKYNNWIKSAQQDLNFKYRIDETFKYNLLLKNVDPAYKIDLTAILNSEDDFLKEYHRICSIMQIEPVDESALILYKDWYTTRVAYYMD